MQNSVQREALLERRAKNDISNNILWDKLSLAQKFAASSLIKYGYALRFLRNSNEGSLAIMICEGNPATISSEGEIDSSPNIIIRA